MRVLLDECLPRQLASLLGTHFVSSVQREGWAGTKNGELLALASQRFDVFVTGDAGLRYQQNSSRFSIAVIALETRDNRVETIASLAPAIRSALETIEPGSIVRLAE